MREELGYRQVEGEKTLHTFVEGVVGGKLGCAGSLLLGVPLFLCLHNGPVSDLSDNDQTRLHVHV